MNYSAQPSILVVDDNEFVLETVAMLLAGAGYKVVSCQSAEKALSELNVQRFDAILTDFKMPGLSGLDFIDRARKLDCDTPIVLMTAYMEALEAEGEVSKTAFDVIAKPFRPQDVFRSIRNAVSFYRQKTRDKGTSANGGTGKGQ